jgi:hypothetical protein
MMKTAITPLRKVELCTVTVATKLGDLYTFPAMDKKALAKVLPRVNASMAILSIPLQIVSKVLVDNQDWWDCPA